MSVTAATMPRMQAATPLERQLHGPRAPRAEPIDAFERARERFLAGERLDMQQLAAGLGLHRTTLYRWVGTRDRLVGEILWSMAEPALRAAVESAGRARGGERIARAVEHYLRGSLEAPFMRRFLEEEPEFALRVLTTKEGVVQARSVDFVREWLEEEIARGLEPPMPAEDLAYLIVRIGETFLYADVITGGEPAPEKAAQAVRALLR